MTEEKATPIAPKRSCGFCDHDEDTADCLVAGRGTLICGDCVKHANDIVNDYRWKKSSIIE